MEQNNKIKEYKKKISSHKKALKVTNGKIQMLKHLLNNRYENDYSKYKFSTLNDNDFKESIHEEIHQLTKSTAINTKMIKLCNEGINAYK